LNIEEFARIARREAWLEEPVGFAMDVDAAASWPPKSFRVTSVPPESVQELVFELEWTGTGENMAALCADFFRFYGWFAEETQFIDRKVEGRVVVFTVIVGNQRHGHRAAFRGGGDSTTRLVGSYLRNVEENKQFRKSG
jgi:hypothetical protein